MHHKLDNDTAVFFYEQEFYVLSNFSAFHVRIWGCDFDTAEHAYQWAKFGLCDPNTERQKDIADLIISAQSAHEAFKIAEAFVSSRDPQWEKKREGYMENILWFKAKQHEYVRRKLLQTGDRRLVEDSWRDSFWGWGPDMNGRNMLGELWMKVRERLREEN